MMRINGKSDHASTRRNVLSSLSLPAFNNHDFRQCLPDFILCLPTYASVGWQTKIFSQNQSLEKFEKTDRWKICWEIRNNESNVDEIGNNGIGNNGTEVKNTVWGAAPLEKKHH
ncbi:MAG: hypothetical protein ACLVB3_09455 [Clostridium sp.]